MAIRAVAGLARRTSRRVEKLYVVHADDPLGERSPDEVRTMRPHIEKVGSARWRAAGRAWEAYRQPTPKAWRDLIDDEIDVLPHLRHAVLLLLGKLPASDTALGATERLLLDVVATGPVGPRRSVHVNTRLNSSRVFGACDEYRILGRLGGCPAPAVLGLDDPTFGQASMDDRERTRHYLASEPTLSEFGRALIDGREDFARRNPIHRWWGGTLLTNETCGAGDAGRQRLVPPD